MWAVGHQTGGGGGVPGPRTEEGTPSPDRDAEVGSPPLLTSEHRLGPRNYGHHHGLLVILPFLAFERHLEAVERGALGLQSHGAARGVGWGGILVTGRRGRARRPGRLRRLPLRAPRSPLPAARRSPAQPADGRVWASLRPRPSRPRGGGEGSIRGPSPPPLPFMEAHCRRPPGRAAGPRPRLRAANRVWPRPGHAAPLESRGPARGGQGRGLPAAPARRGGGRWPAGEDPELLPAGSVRSRPAEPDGSSAICDAEPARCLHVGRYQAPQGFDRARLKLLPERALLRQKTMSRGQGLRLRLWGSDLMMRITVDCYEDTLRGLL